MRFGLKSHFLIRNRNVKRPLNQMEKKIYCLNYTFSKKKKKSFPNRKQEGVFLKIYGFKS
jgi:hypothetical protein